MKKLRNVSCKKIRGIISKDFGCKLLVLMCIAGILFGSLAAAGTEQGSSGLSVLTQDYFAERTSSGFFSVLFKSFLSSFSFLAVAFLLGNFNFGCFIVGAVPFFKGYGIGTALGFMFRSYGAKGLAYSALIIIPGAVVSSMVMIFAAYSSAKLSYELLKKLMGKVGKERFKLDFSKYCKQYAVYAVLCFAAALLETASNAVFSGLFDF